MTRTSRTPARIVVVSETDVEATRTHGTRVKRAPRARIRTQAWRPRRTARRLWQRWREIDRNLDAYAARRPRETAVVVFEPLPEPA